MTLRDMAANDLMLNMCQHIMLAAMVTTCAVAIFIHKVDRKSYRKLQLHSSKNGGTGQLCRSLFDF